MKKPFAGFILLTLMACGNPPFTDDKKIRTLIIKMRK